MFVAPFAAYRVVRQARSALTGGSSLVYAGWLTLLLGLSAVVLLSTIRAPLLGLGASLIAFGILVRGWRPVRRMELAGAAAVLVACGVLVMALTGGRWSSTVERFLTIGGTLDSSSQRLTVWQDTVHALLADPARSVVGYGDETQAAIFEHSQATMRRTPIELWDRAHNLLLDTWLTRGLIGLAALLVLVGFALRSAWLARQHGSLSGAAVLAALVGHLVEVSFSFHAVVTGALFWFLLGLAASLTPRVRREARAAKPWLEYVAAATAVLLVPLRGDARRH